MYRWCVTCIGVAGFIVTGGVAMADDAATEELRAIRTLLESMEQRLEAIEKKLEARPAAAQSVPRHDGFVAIRADPDVLAKIKLPDEPTRDDVRRYLAEIIAATAGQNSFSPSDEQVGMILRIGSEHMDVVLEQVNDHHVQYAIPLMLRHEHKELVLDALARYPQLVEYLARMGWEEEAREILVSELKARPGHLPPAWVAAVATFRDPQTYDDLKEALARGNNPEHVHEAIRHLPDIELNDAVERAWRTRNVGQFFGGQRRGIARVAVQYGHIDALEMLVDQLNQPPESWDRRQAAEVIRRHTDARGSDEDLAEWFKTNRENLHFDKERRRWVVVAPLG